MNSFAQFHFLRKSSFAIKNTLFLFQDESGHISLDFGGKKKVISEEIQQEQRAIKSQKRKELELVKREEDKKKTMDRLLLKKDSKAAKLIKATSKRQAGHNVPKWTYKINADGPTLSVPVGADYPVNPTKISTPPPTIKCSVSECPNSKIWRPYASEIRGTTNALLSYSENENLKPVNFFNEELKVKKSLMNC